MKYLLITFLLIGCTKKLEYTCEETLLLVKPNKELNESNVQAELKAACDEVTQK